MTALLTRSPTVGVEPTVDVQAVLLPGSRRTEPRAHAAPHEPGAARHLAVGRRPEVLEVLEAHRRAQRPRLVRIGHLQVAVGRDVVAAPGARLRRAVGEDAVRAGHEALRRVRPDRPSRAVPRPEAELLVTPFRAGGEVDPAGDRMRHVEVQVDVPLAVPPDVERVGRHQAERRVDGVVDEEVGVVDAERAAQVPVEAAGGEAAHAPHQRRAPRHAPGLRRKAAGVQLLKREAVRVVGHLPQRDRVGHQVGHGDRRAVGRAHAAGRQHVADQQRAAPVVAEHAEPRVRITEEDAVGHLLARIARVGVRLHPGGERVAEVAECLQVVVDLRIAPDLRMVRRDVRIAGGDQRNGVAPRRGPVGRIRVAVLQAEVGETGCAQRQADVAGEPGRFAVAGAVHPGVQLDGTAGRGVLELEVHHPGDGVRAVLGRRAVAQHFDLPQRNRGDGRDVGALRAERHAVAAVPVDDRGAVPALAVDQHQRVVRGQVAQHGGADHRRPAADRLRVGAERRDDGAELVLRIARPLADQIGGRQHVDRHR